ncbi:hypothetical protein MPC4_270062 [Methylocella tundrae]|uniref:Uncharacterized protein n=1 Tax=Methylocella tundrae TaxID=227605 RepID=A0A8B6M895_METTU|nr:hypothetical protein MPC4_270062 [Methylocella tundrae]
MLSRGAVGKITAASARALVEMLPDFLDRIDGIAAAAILDRGGNALPFRRHLAQISFVNANQVRGLGRTEMPDRLFGFGRKYAAVMGLELARQFGAMLLDQRPQLGPGGGYVCYGRLRHVDIRIRLERHLRSFTDIGKFTAFLKTGPILYALQALLS